MGLENPFPKSSQIHGFMVPEQGGERVDVTMPHGYLGEKPSF
jgi:hypothetical protein